MPSQIGMPTDLRVWQRITGLKTAHIEHTAHMETLFTWSTLLTWSLDRRYSTEM